MLFYCFHFRYHNMERSIEPLKSRAMRPTKQKFPGPPEKLLNFAAGLAVSTAMIWVTAAALIAGGEWRERNHQQQYSQAQSSGSYGKVHICTEDNHSQVCEELRQSKAREAFIFVDDVDGNKDVPHVKFD